MFILLDHLAMLFLKSAFQKKKVSFFVEPGIYHNMSLEEHR